MYDASVKKQELRVSHLESLAAWAELVDMRTLKLKKKAKIAAHLSYS